MRFLELIPENVLSQITHEIRILEGSRILITGGTGFWGTSLLYALLELQETSGAPPIQIDILSRNPEAFLLRHPKVKQLRTTHFLKGDLQYLLLQDKTWDYVFHLATSEISKDLLHKQDRNDLSWKPDFVVESERLVRFLNHRVARKVFLASSGAVYRPNSMGIPQAELSVADIQRYELPSVYAEKKRIIETLFLKSELDTVIGRGFATYGPFLSLNSGFAVSSFMSSLKRNEAIRLSSNGEAVRGMLESADLALWMWTILAKGSEQVYHLGSDQEVKVVEIARIIAALSAPPLEVQLGEAPPDGVRDYYVPAVNHARKLGLDTWTSLDAGLRRMKDWLI